MAIKNPEALANAITKWIEDRILNAGQKYAVFGLSGGVDSALVALLCKRSHNIRSVGVIMPCHSSGSAAERATELATKIGLQTVTVDLSKAHDLLAGQIGPALFSANIPNEQNNATDGALRSCLRAPTLDYVSKRVGGLIIGTGNRDEDAVTRYFQKRGDGAVDCSPIAEVHKSEVYELAKFLGCTDAILNAVPTADLWGPDSGQTDEGQLGIKYPEIEWSIGLHDRTKAVFVGIDPLPSRIESKLSEREKHVLMTLKSMELSSRHKAEMPPVLNLRDAKDSKGEPLFEPTYDYAALLDINNAA